MLVSGAPGSGKTTLARELARVLRLFHLDRDDLWDGLRFTAARGGGEGVAHGVDVWFATITLMLRSGVSLVADGTLYRGRSEADVRPLLELGEIVNVHCRAAGALDRYRARLLREGPVGGEVAALVARAAAAQGPGRGGSRPGLRADRGGHRPRVRAAAGGGGRKDRQYVDLPLWQ